MGIKLLGFVGLLWAASALGARSVDIVAIETSEALEDNAGESHSVKCAFLNPSNRPQNFLVTYYDVSNVSNAKAILPATGAKLPASVSGLNADKSITLNPNESFTILFCKGKSASDCEEPSVSATPIRINVTVSNNDGYLLGNCVSHFSDNANKHRASALSVAGGKPF